MRQRASQKKALVNSTSFMYNGKEMNRALCVCSLVNQMLELLGRIRIGRFMRTGKRWRMHTDFFVRETIAFYYQRNVVNKHTIKHYKTKKTRGFLVLHERKQHALQNFSFSNTETIINLRPRFGAGFIHISNLRLVAARFACTWRKARLCGYL